MLEKRALDQDKHSFATFFDPMIQNYLGQNALHIACKKGFTRVVSEMLVYVFQQPGETQLKEIRR